MYDWRKIQDRYMQDELPVRLGGLAANLSRVKSFASNDNNQTAVASLLEESKLFIEWTAKETKIETAGELAELQIQLAVWTHSLDRIWQDLSQRQDVIKQSNQWSQKVLELSGLLN